MLYTWHIYIDRCNLPKKVMSICRVKSPEKSVERSIYIYTYIHTCIQRDRETYIHTSLSLSFSLSLSLTHTLYVYIYNMRAAPEFIYFHSFIYIYIDSLLIKEGD